jgi:hypothetical protein
MTLRLVHKALDQLHPWDLGRPPVLNFGPELVQLFSWLPVYTGVFVDWVLRTTSSAAVSHTVHSVSYAPPFGAAIEHILQHTLLPQQ